MEPTNCDIHLQVMTQQLKAWLLFTYKSQPVTFWGLIATISAGAFAIVPAAIGVSTIEWADTASKWATLITSFVTMTLAVLQVVVSFSVHAEYKPTGAGDSGARNDPSADILLFKPSGRTVKVYGKHYDVSAMMVKEGSPNNRPKKTKLFCTPGGELSARGVQNDYRVNYYREGSYKSERVGQNLIIYDRC
jgi:hypothetical protein